MKFSYKDKSGRGITNNNLTLSDLLKWEDLQDWNGNSLHQWAEESEPGDQWENATVRITRIK